MFRFDVEDRHDSTKACPYRWTFAEDESGPNHGVYYLRHRTLTRRFKALTRRMGAESMRVVVEPYPIARGGEQKQADIVRDYRVPKVVSLGDMAHNVVESLCEDLMKMHARREPIIRRAGLQALSRNGHEPLVKKESDDNGPLPAA